MQQMGINDTQHINYILRKSLRLWGGIIQPQIEFGIGYQKSE